MYTSGEIYFELSDTALWVSIGNVRAQSSSTTAIRRTQVKFLKAFWGQALIVALAVCALALPIVARAQSEIVPELSRDWNVRIGVYIFNQNATARKNGRVGISGFGERTVYHGEQFDITVGIGYNGFDRIYSVPVTGQLIFHPNSWRLGAGVGYAFNKRIDGSGSNGSVFNLLLGYTLTRGRYPTNVDMRYFFVGGSNNELDGLSVTYGLKF